MSVCSLCTCGKKLIHVSVQVTVAKVKGHYSVLDTELSALGGSSDQMLPDLDSEPHCTASKQGSWRWDSNFSMTHFGE